MGGRRQVAHSSHFRHRTKIWKKMFQSDQPGDIIPVSSWSDTLVFFMIELYSVTL